MFCGKLDGFAFLPADKVPAEGMAYLKDNTPPEPLNLLTTLTRAM